MGESEPFSIVTIDEKKPYFFWFVTLFPERVDVIDVAFAFGHFPIVYIEMMAVKPKFGHGVRANRFQNCTGIIMVAIKVVDAAAID